MKIKGSVSKIKNKGVTRSFSANFRRFGPGLEEKRDWLVRERKKGHRWSHG